MQPNILYLHSHDSGRYIQPYGHAVPTPHLQKLAEESLLFRHAFCACPTCSPSRAALVTGSYPHSNGMIGLAHRGWDLNDTGQHIVNTLKPAGYTTALSGVQHVARGTEDRLAWQVIGYDQGLEPERKGDFAGAAVRFLSNAPAQPFFLSVGFADTHREYLEPGPAEDAQYSRPPDPLPDTPETRHDMACYKASARVLDEKMGTVLRALDDNGLRDNTLVICTTDHGIAFPRMKCNLNVHGMGVMLMMRYPGLIAGGTVTDALVSQVDIFPTICELLDLPIPDWVQGTSLVPILKGEAEEVNDAIYGDLTYHASYEPVRSIRTTRWNYVRQFDDFGRTVRPNCDDSPSKTLWMDAGWGDRPVPREELYDLMFDPHETRNLAGDPAVAATRQDLAQRLQAWMEATSDPILKGPVPIPDGARVNPREGMSPKQPMVGKDA